MRVENRSSCDKSYTGIDLFRLAAALLIITIHTSPLADLSDTADFILTRIAARVAVPFFFVTSGFFLISRYHDQPAQFRGFVVKTALIYAAAALFYFTVTLYNALFTLENMLQ